MAEETYAAPAKAPGLGPPKPSGFLAVVNR